MGSSSKDEGTEIFPALRVYKDGTVKRFFGSPYVPPSPQQDPTTGVSSKDITISPDVSARLYLPNITQAHQVKKLPVLVYFHAGGFCFESAFSLFHHTFIGAVVSQSEALVVSVEYRQPPERPLPAAYEDSWAAIQWVTSHSVTNPTVETDPWLINHADFDRLYIGGDSAGANIAHNMAMRVGKEPLNGDVKILGGYIGHPYFWGSRPIGGEEYSTEMDWASKLWEVAYPSAVGGIDNPMINPFAVGAPSLAGLRCRRLLVCVGEKDGLRERGIGYYKAVKESGWEGELELVEVEGVDHGYHILNPDHEKTKFLVKRLASFIMA